MTLRRRGRILAFQALYSWDIAKTPLDELTSFSWLDQEEKPEVQNFARFLLSGTLENIEAIDTMIRTHLHNWTLFRLKRVDLALLRMSAFALMFQKDIAPSIVIDEAIAIAIDFGTNESFRFVNGVLDSISRDLYPPENKASS
jgi:N utilization substance protein B